MSFLPRPTRFRKSVSVSGSSAIKASLYLQNLAVFLVLVYGLLKGPKKPVVDTHNVYSLFEIVNGNYPINSVFFINLCVAGSLKMANACVFALVLYNFCKDASFKNIRLTTYSILVLEFVKKVCWLLFNFIPLKDSQLLQFQGLFLYLICDLTSLYLWVFGIQAKSAQLYQLLNRSSTLGFNPYVYKSFFAKKLPFWKVNLGVYTVLVLSLGRYLYFHQVANDLTYLSYYNAVSWIVVVYSSVWEYWVLESFGIDDLNVKVQ